MTSDERLKAFIEAKYPLTAKYDLKWTQENSLGSNAVILAESLSRVMDLKPGMRVMDMGCGKAVSSIFLAKEFGVTVFAVTYGTVYPTTGSGFAKPVYRI